MELLIWLPVPILLVFGFLGFRDGLIKRALEVIGILATILLTARFATEMLPWMKENTGLPEGAALMLTWAALFFVGFVLTKLLAALVSRLVRLTILGWVDKGGGALLGVFIGVLFCSVVLVAGSQIPGGERIQQAYDRTFLGRTLFYAAPDIYRSAQGLSGGRAAEVWSRVLDKVRDTADRAAGDAAQDALGDRADEAREKLEEVRDKTGG